jgi:hypothetical protein
MCQDFLIPRPVLFNCWKHHKLFIQKEIERFIKTNSPEVMELLKKQLLIIGESQTDLYTGILTPGEIVNSITNQLRDINAFEIVNYKEWLLKAVPIIKPLRLMTAHAGH